ncbi:bacteriohemerythrin [Sulfurospirillum sp. 1307]
MLFIKKKESNIIDLTWNELLSLENTQIDNEHKKLFRIAQSAFSVVSPDKKMQKIKDVLKELINYTKTHFSNEEKYMSSIGYPDLEEHKKQHQQIVDSMYDFTRKLPNMKINEIEKELAHLIEIWFVNHIVYNDKKIAAWLKLHEIPEFSFSWKDEYALNNSLLDAEHQELFKIASEAFKKVPKEEKLNKIKKTLNQLFEYFKTHFEDEEKYMLEIKFDKLDAHKKSHEQIIHDLSSFVKNLHSMEIFEIEDKLKDFIQVSLVEHIINEDKKIISWIQYLKDLKEAKDLKV